MDVLKYRDYQGSVSYDDGVLIVQLLHVDDFVAAEFQSAADAQKVFEELVDDYLDACSKAGKEPSKPFKGSFNVRLTPEMHKRVATAATVEGGSLNAWVVHAIECKLSGKYEQGFPSYITEDLSRFLRAAQDQLVFNAEAKYRYSVNVTGAHHSGRLRQITKDFHEESTNLGEAGSIRTAKLPREITDLASGYWKQN